MHKSEFQRSPNSIFQCVAQQGPKRCVGPLLAGREDGKLVCEDCGMAYPVYKGVPILRLVSLESVECDQRYSHRNRVEELAKGWYQEEREKLRAYLLEYGVSGKILELGCGNGLMAEGVANYVGLEYSPSALLDTGWADEERVCGDGQILPFRAEVFNAIFSINVIEHIPQVDSVFEEMHRVLQPGGYLFLRPAWHCVRANTELIPIKKYNELNFRQKVIKALLPVMNSKLFKFATRVPWRFIRWTFTRGPQKMQWGRLTPHPLGVNAVYSLPKYLPDTDACSSIDSHETIMYYVRRGYQCMSHKTVFRQLMAGHDWVVMQKKK